MKDTDKDETDGDIILVKINGMLVWADLPEGIKTGKMPIRYREIKVRPRRI